MESTGAMYPELTQLLRKLGQLSTAPGTDDNTQYGRSRSSPKTFLTHHAAAISCAVCMADA